MSVAALPAARPTLASRLRPRGTLWLIWRQNRLALLAVTVVFVGIGAYLLRERFQLDAAVARYHALDCEVAPGAQACAGAGLTMYEVTSDWMELAPGLLALPGLLGAVLAAQPLAMDFERGRHLLLWSQSVSPRRWLTYRLALPASVLLVLSTVLSVIVRWVAYWSHPDPELSFWSPTLGLHDLVPVYPVLTLAAFALGALVGLLIHRTVPALGVTLGLYAVLVYGLERVYPFLLPLHRRTITGYTSGHQQDWVYRTGYVVPDRVRGRREGHHPRPVLARRLSGRAEMADLPHACGVRPDALDRGGAAGRGDGAPVRGRLPQAAGPHPLSRRPLGRRPVCPRFPRAETARPARWERWHAGRVSTVLETPVPRPARVATGQTLIATVISGRGLLGRLAAVLSVHPVQALALRTPSAGPAVVEITVAAAHRARVRAKLLRMVDVLDVVDGPEPLDP